MPFFFFFFFNIAHLGGIPLFLSGRLTWYLGFLSLVLSSRNSIRILAPPSRCCAVCITCPQDKAINNKKEKKREKKENLTFCTSPHLTFLNISAYIYFLEFLGRFFSPHILAKLYLFMSRFAGSFYHLIVSRSHRAISK